MLKAKCQSPHSLPWGRNPKPKPLFGHVLFSYLFRLDKLENLGTAWNT